MIVTSLRTFALGFCLASASTAAAQSVSVYNTDPLDVPSSPVLNPTAQPTWLWQTDPFGVGYDLLGGYRPIYTGARQSIGHEIIPTRADGNGYVYRPVYAASPGYHYTPGGALIIEYPRQHPTRADAPFPTLPPEQPLPLPPGNYDAPSLTPAPPLRVREF